MSLALARVLAAWTVPGPAPRYHDAMKNKLRREWPALASALDALTTSERKTNP